MRTAAIIHLATAHIVKLVTTLIQTTSADQKKGLAQAAHFHRSAIRAIVKGISVVRIKQLMLAADATLKVSARVAFHGEC